MTDTTDAPAVADQPMTKSRFVVLPDAEDPKGRAFLRLLPVDGEVNRDNERHFLRDKSNARLHVASVYEIEHTETSYRLSAAVYIEPYPDEARRVAWQSQQKAFDLAKDQAAREKREAGKTNHLEARLEPLRLAYQSLPAPHRLGFELWVLSVLRRKG